MILTRRVGAIAVAHRTDKSRYKPVIGLEVHVQLNTRTKLFSRCPTSEASPNRRVLPFDMATPGTLPLLNRQAVLRALKMARLLGCCIPESSRFDRKHYFYADMPAGYQITQNERPIARNGKFGFHVFDEHWEPYWKQVEIQQLQLEQDSGKTIHLDERRSLVDYNRAGCALVEVVTTPCFETALEAIRFVQHLRLLLIHHDICDGELHKGHIRVDANVSLSFDENEGVRTEIKNMNSMRTIHTAINYEIARQFEILSAGGHVANETRAADSEGRTVSMRDKEEETDYRFMVEPNLPMLVVRDEWMEQVDEQLENQGMARFEVLREQHGFDPRSAVHIAEDPLLSSFIDNCLIYKNPSVTAADILYWMKELKICMQRSKCTFPPQSQQFARHFTQLLVLAREQRLTRLRLLDLLRHYSTSSEEPKEDQDLMELCERSQFWRVKNADKIREMVSFSMENNGKLVEKVKMSGAKNGKHFNRLRNLIIEETNKCIELEELEQAIRYHLEHF